MFFRKAGSKAILGSVYERFVESAPVGLMPAPLPGHPTRNADGSWMASTQHRPKALRQVRDEPMPGEALVVLDPEPMLVLEMIPCEDGHAQERVQLPRLLELVRARELWLGGRNLCTLGWVGGVEERQAYFVMRQHAGFPLESLEESRRLGLRLSLSKRTALGLTDQTLQRIGSCP
jgi:hypothetical protein